MLFSLLLKCEKPPIDEEETSTVAFNPTGVILGGISSTARQELLPDLSGNDKAMTRQSPDHRKSLCRLNMHSNCLQHTL